MANVIGFGCLKKIMSENSYFSITLNLTLNLIGMEQRVYLKCNAFRLNNFFSLFFLCFCLSFFYRRIKHRKCYFIVDVRRTVRFVGWSVCRSLGELKRLSFCRLNIQTNMEITWKIVLVDAFHLSAGQIGILKIENPFPSGPCR